MRRTPPHKVILFANTDWYLYNFRLALARAIQSTGSEVVLMSPPGPFAHRFEELGFRWLPIEMTRRGINPLREFSNLIGLTLAIHREKPTLIHSFTVKGVVFGSLAARLARVPARVNAITGLGFIFTSSRLFATVLRPMVTAMLRWLLRGSFSRLILQNPDDVEDLLNRKIASPSNTLLIRGSGVDTTRFRPAEPREGPTRKVLMATRMLWSKGVKEYVTAAALVRLMQPNIEFLLAGEPDDGNPASVPDTVIRQWRDAGIVQYLGHVQPMEDLLRKVDAVVLPTLYREGVPRILIEAAAAGLPLIASDARGCREIVKHGINGLLIPPGSAEALAISICDLFSDDKRYRRMGIASRDIALREFDETVVIEKTIAVYRQLVPSFPVGTQITMAQPRPQGVQATQTSIDNPRPAQRG